MTAAVKQAADLPPRRFCLAPMMEYSDRHCRYLWRLFSKNAWLYTEMVTTGAIVHGDRQRFLQFNQSEQPVALQLGGSDPAELAECARIAEQWGYDEVNLNCGCPSDRVQNNRIGAILMKDSGLVAECFQAMQNATSIPVTVKHRIGVDDMDDYPGLLNFVDTVAEAGCKTFIVHARKAWLQGLSPKQNREVPPLRYDLVYRLKQERPELEIIINGGITQIEQARGQLGFVDGVMVGREAYHKPNLLAEVDSRFYQSNLPGKSQFEVFQSYAQYCQQQLALDVRLGHTARHLLGLFHGLPGARLYRRYLSEHIHRPDANCNLLWSALALIQHQDNPITTQQHQPLPGQLAN